MEGTVIAAKKGPNKKFIIIGVIVTLIALAGIITAIFLTRERQLIEQEAAVPAGVAKIYITPEAKSIAVGESFDAKVIFDTAGTKVSALTVQLEYQFTGSEPSISADQITINTNLATNQMWDFPVKNISTQGSSAFIKIAGFSSSIDGYSTTGQEELATISFTGVSQGSIIVTFNSTESKITKKEDGADILLIPQSTGVYTVSGGGTNPTATPGSTSTPSPNTSPTPVPTPAPPIPQTGISLPTIATLSGGIILILASILLAL